MCSPVYPGTCSVGQTGIGLPLPPSTGTTGVCHHYPALATFNESIIVFIEHFSDTRHFSNLTQHFDLMIIVTKHN